MLVLGDTLLVSLLLAPLIVVTVLVVALSPFTIVAVETSDEGRKADVGSPRVCVGGQKADDDNHNVVSATPQRSSLVCARTDCLILFSLF